MSYELNEEQKNAVEAKDKKIVIIAPPGSGKTFTMTKAIDDFYTHTDAQKVVAITFTKKAAAELSDYFYGINHVHTATIHSWSYTHLEELAKKWGFRVRLLQEEQILSIIKPFLKLYKLDEHFLLMSVYYYVMGNYNMDLEDNLKNKYKAILDKYIEFKRRRKLYDFTDLPLYLYDVLVEYEEEIKVDALFVDEFQDVDPVQLKVFRKVVAKKYFFIGDPDQAIYIFRGASAEIFEELHDYKIMPLKHNYRSYQKILDYAYTVRQNLLGGGQYIFMTRSIRPTDVVAVRGKGGFLYPESMHTKVEFRRKVRDELINHQYQILCRTNKQVKVLTKLGFENVSTIHKAKGLEFDNVVVIDFKIEDDEDINVAFVALTRAKNREIIMQFETALRVLEALPKTAKTRFQFARGF